MVASVLAKELVFYVNGTRRQAAGYENISLNDYIRQYTPFKGTKLACGEGGCGACAVQVARFDAVTGTTHTSSINSCLCPVGSLDGISVTTVEGLGNTAAGFSSVQERFAEHHASQCGFCTPGFVVACHTTLARCAEDGDQATPEKMMQGLDGNLCRCTGYMPILEACKSLTTDMEDLCNRPLPPADAFPDELKRYVQAKSEVPWPENGGSACVAVAERGRPVWVWPRTLREVFKALSNPQCGQVHVVAGNTAAGVYHEWPEAPVLISLRDVRELSRSVKSKDGLEFGAAVCFADIIQKLTEEAGRSKDPEPYSNMAAHIKRIAELPNVLEHSGDFIISFDMLSTGSHVRWAATPGGNLALLRHPDYYLESDFATVLAGAGGRVEVSSGSESRWLSVPEFLNANASIRLGTDHLITGVFFPAFGEGDFFWSHKVAQRFYNSHALTNLAVSWRGGGSSRSDFKIAVGCPTVFREGPGCEAKVAWQLRCAPHAEHVLNSNALDAEVLVAALEALQKDICPGSNEDAPAEYYRATAEGLLFQSLAKHLPESGRSGREVHRLLQVSSMPAPGVPKSSQNFPEPPHEQAPVGLPVLKDRIRLQASGEAVYSSDVGVGGPQLYAGVVPSTHALAVIDDIDSSEALKLEGVAAFVGAKDVPGENRVFLGGGDAEIFASERVDYVHQPLGLILADTPEVARKAVALVKVTYSHPKELGKPILTIRDAIQAGSYFEIPDGAGGTVHRGDVAKAMAEATHVIRNARYTIPSQQHFYMETQAAVAEPQEAGTFLVHSSTQSIDGVQSAVARALGVPAHNVVAVCRRVGGGFGGKVARSMPVAAAAAVAASKAGRTVHYQQSRNEDFCMNGGRSEAEVEYDVAFDGDGKISALSVRAWFLAGADLDLAWNDMMILQTGADQVYDIPNIDLDLKVVRTNLPPRTIMRGPGFMDAAMVAEQVLEHVVDSLGLDPEETRSRNFLRAPAQMAVPGPQKAGFTFSEESTTLETPAAAAEETASLAEGAVNAICARARPDPKKISVDRLDPSMMKTTLSRPFKAESWTLPRIWEGLIARAEYHKRKEAVKHFNRENVWRKRGISINPCRFDSAPQPMIAQVNIYYDGSILLTHGGLEVGQGLSTKVKQMAVYELSKLLPKNLRPLPLELFRINDTRSDIVPNSGPTWSSTGSESACAAVQEACKQLVKSLLEAAKGVETDEAAAFWKAAVTKVHSQVGYVPAAAALSAVGFYDGTDREGDEEPLVYTSFGAAISEVELDILTGEKSVRRCDIHFDCGQSLNPMIDMGQVEGAFIQGLGYLTSEEVRYDKTTGHLLTNGTWKYKPPAASCIPQEMNIEFLKDSPNPRGILGSKASGEPSLLLSTSILYALRQAVVAAQEGLAAERSLSGKANPITVRNGKSASGEDPFFVLAAPATTVRLKQACGEFSVASILKAALESSSLDSDESWVKVG